MGVSLEVSYLDGHNRLYAEGTIDLEHLIVKQRTVKNKEKIKAS